MTTVLACLVVGAVCYRAGIKHERKRYRFVGKPLNSQEVLGVFHDNRTKN